MKEKDERERACRYALLFWDSTVSGAPFYAQIWGLELRYAPKNLDTNQTNIFWESENSEVKDISYGNWVVSDAQTKYPII